MIGAKSGRDDGLDYPKDSEMAWRWIVSYMDKAHEASGFRFGGELAPMNAALARFASGIMTIAEFRALRAPVDAFFANDRRLMFRHSPETLPYNYAGLALQMDETISNGEVDVALEFHTTSLRGLGYINPDGGALFRKFFWGQTKP